MTTEMPNPEVLAAFGASSESPEGLAGGRGMTWRAGDLVLRPRGDADEANWRSEFLANFQQSDRFRVPRPIRASDGRWDCAGWEAWQWLHGQTDLSRVADTISAGSAFHEAIANVGRPTFLDYVADLWSRADRMAWEEQPLPHSETLDRLAREFEPVTSPRQLIHGDLLGNVLFAPNGPPAIIDWAPYWRPAGYGAAIAAIDAACWHDWPADQLAELGATFPEWGQLLVRALVFRIATQHNHERWDADMETRHAPAVAAAINAARAQRATTPPNLHQPLDQTTNCDGFHQ